MAEPTAAAVADWLRRHPDFLVRNPDLLAAMAPPDRGAGRGVVDLQRAMVERERRTNRDLQGAVRELLDIGAENHEGLLRIHEAALRLGGLRRLGEVAAAVAEDWPERLGCDGAVLAFETRREALPPARGLAALAAGRVDALLGEGAEARLAGGLAGGPEDLFGPDASLVASMALLRLPAGRRRPAGLLAFRSSAPANFEEGQGAELLIFLARLLAGHLAMLIDPPEAL